MAQIVRLKDTEISNGNIVDADDLDSEFNQLVSESNSQDTRLTDLESSTMTIAGVKTFSSTPKMNAIDERTGGTGVTVDGVLLKDSMIKASSASPTLTEGYFAYDDTANVYKGHNGSSTVTFLTTGGAYPTGYLQGPHIKYNSATQVIIPTGLKCRDDSDAVNITFSSNTTIDITTATGAAVTNCLMNGLTENSSTWYFLWAISDGTNAKGLLTTSSSTIATYPTGYSYKRLLGAVRNDSSSNFIPFVVTGSWQTPEYLYYVNQAGGGQTVGPTNVLDGGTQTTYTNVDLSAFVPSISELPTLRVQTSQVSSPQNVFIRKDGASADEWQQYKDGERYMGETFKWPCSTSQIIEYKVVSSGTVDISVVGFTITGFTL